ncbi:hypothetical protein M9Y10_029427 [Tritrichomonas musculus]|uniref:Small GTP-binding protein n=1 Tax=Tritrichomonas musculus TaxID=1915356 RepID=A0ABR2KM98_9EUKA
MTVNCITMKKKTQIGEEALKIILLGDSSVGKTSLINSWLNETFEPETRPTIGTSNFFKTVELSDESEVKISLWDTAGQEQYRTIAPLYIRGSKVAIIVTSSIDSQSFKSISFWIELISATQVNDTKLILAINKIDLMDSAIDDLTDLIEEYKPKFDQFFCVSAKTGENVDSLFIAAAFLAKEVQSLSNNNSIAEFNELKTNRSCC